MEWLVGTSAGKVQGSSYLFYAVSKPKFPHESVAFQDIEIYSILKGQPCRNEKNTWHSDTLTASSHFSFCVTKEYI